MKEVVNIKHSKSNLMIGCSVKGRGKSCNQDHFRCYADKNKVMCVIADGLGSAINSETGSKNICEVAMAILKGCNDYSHFSELLKEQWIKSLPYKPISCDTTFKFFVITEEEIFYGGIGDGWICGIIDGELLYYSVHNNFANQTDSMMSIAYEEKFKLFQKKYKEISILSLATDGFSEDIDSESISRFLCDCIEIIREKKEEFADELERLIENWPIQSNIDDKTVVFYGG